MKKKQTVREFRLPLLNFNAKHYSRICPIKIRKVPIKDIPLGFEGDHPKRAMFPVYILNYKGPLQQDEVFLPPLLNLAESLEVEDIVKNPIRFEIENHTQSVEHGVALTTECAKKKRTEETRLWAAMNTNAARKAYPEPITHKLYRSKADY